MALKIEHLQKPLEGGEYISDRRLCLTADGEICEETDTRAVSLLVSIGGRIPGARAKELGLVGASRKKVKASSEPEPVADSDDDEDDEDDEDSSEDSSGAVGEASDDEDDEDDAEDDEDADPPVSEPVSTKKPRKSRGKRSRR